jgi:hypothetical protein
MVDVIASNAIDAMYWKRCVATGNRDGSGRVRRKNELHDGSLSEYAELCHCLLVIAVFKNSGSHRAGMDASITPLEHKSVKKPPCIAGLQGGFHVSEG